MDCCVAGAGILRKLHLKGLGGFAVAPGGGPHLAAYVPEAKGSPGVLPLLQYQPQKRASKKGYVHITALCSLALCNTC